MTMTRPVGRLLCSLLGVCLFHLCLGRTASAQTVVQHGWEDGTLQGWSAFGGGVALTNAAGKRTSARWSRISARTSTPGTSSTRSSIPAQADGFRRSPWFAITGTEYIERAFRVAREAAPHARLYINDFGTTDEPKRTFLLKLVRDLQNRGVPIDGVGHQMHNNIEYPSAAALIETINQFAALGVDNQITELDVSIYSATLPQPFSAYEDIPQDRFVKQAFKYRDFFNVFRHAADHISSVTLWGQADDHTWLTSSARVNAPLLFDTDLKHKLPYTAAINPSQLPGSDSTANFAGAYVLTGVSHAARRTAAATLTLTNSGPSGTLRFNFNDPSTRIRFTSADVITFDVSSSGSGSRADFTVVGTNAGTPGYIVTGYAIDAGPPGSGLDVVSITVRTATGALVFSGTGPVTDGDVVVNVVQAFGFQPER